MERFREKSEAAGREIKLEHAASTTAFWRVDSPQSDQARWFAENVQPHESDLRSFLRRRFPGVQDIDDLVQEAYARLIRAHNAGGIAEPRAYLFTTARNVAFDLFRRKRLVSIEDLAEKQRVSVVDDAPDAAATAIHDQEIKTLVEAIQALPLRCREVLTLRKLHGLPYREIANRLGISENTVNAQLALGVIRCRQYLAARGVLKRSGDAIEQP